jgi:hypothetical protein
VVPVVGGAAGVAGAAFGIYKKKQLGKVIKEVFDVVKKYRQMKREDSRGGAEVTAEEIDELITEIEEALVAVTGVFKLK